LINAFNLGNKYVQEGNTSGFGNTCWFKTMTAIKTTILMPMAILKINLS
jgi:hypothetical protein